MGTSSGHANKTLIPSAPVSASGNSTVFDNHNYAGANIGINVTAVSGTTPSMTAFVEGLDEASGVWYPVLQSAPITSTGFTLLSIYHGIAVVANQSASAVLPATFRVRWAITGTTPSFTFTVGACMLK